MRHNPVLYVVLIGSMLVFAGACQPAVENSPARPVQPTERAPAAAHDRTIGINGKIYTSNPDQPWAEAVVVEGQDIVYVGDNDGAMKLATDKSLVGNLHGRMVLPGMIGTHEHGTMLMAFSSGLTMEMSRDAKIMLDAVTEYVAANPEGPISRSAAPLKAPSRSTGTTSTRSSRTSPF